MPDHDELLVVVREWIAKAENDLKNASHTLKLGKDCPTDTVCFHGQQCVEKYLKALLVWRCVRFPKTHSISELLRLLPADGRPMVSPEEQERLTDFAAGTRYPGMYDPILLVEARDVVKLTRRIRREIRQLLPREAKTTQRK
jgi:HEPN domain-containing protein